MTAIQSFLNTLVMFTLAMATSSYGGWVSGGGELLSEDDNPWFLANTPLVHYCVEIDEENMGVARDLARDSVTQAFQYWYGQFELASSNPNLDPKWATGEGKAHVQNIRDLTNLSKVKFEETSCDQEHGLRFQFGTLNDEQKAFLGGKKPVGAVAVRTDYNQEELRGTGFIFVAPPKGPNRYTIPGHWAGKIENPWSFRGGKLLVATLIHEIGHVYGVTHHGLGVMQNNFPRDLIAGRRALQKMSLDPQKNRVIHPDNSELTYAICGDEMVAGSFKNFSFYEFIESNMGFPADWNCLEIKYQTKGLREQVEFWAVEKQGPEKRQLLGKAPLDFVSDVIDRVLEPPSYVIFLALTDKQKVFAKLPKKDLEGFGIYQPRTSGSTQRVQPTNPAKKTFAVDFEVSDEGLRFKPGSRAKVGFSFEEIQLQSAQKLAR